MKTLECDKRQPFKGWAGGNYECKCLGCGESFIGDKRRITCADCAYAPEPASSGNSDLLLRATSDIEFDGQDFRMADKPELVLVLLNTETGAYMTPPLVVEQ